MLQLWNMVCCHLGLNCDTEEQKEADIFFVQFENENGVIPCSVTEESTTSYVLGVYLEIIT